MSDKLRIFIHPRLADELADSLRVFEDHAIFEQTERTETADVVIVGKERDLEEYYEIERKFVLYSRSEPGCLPCNAVWIERGNLIPLVEHLETLSE